MGAEVVGVFGQAFFHDLEATIQLSGSAVRVCQSGKDQTARLGGVSPLEAVDLCRGAIGGHWSRLWSATGAQGYTTIGDRQGNIFERFSGCQRDSRARTAIWGF
jgi:hypothetical protein